MKFSGEQISYAGRDVVEIPAVNRFAAGFVITVLYITAICVFLLVIFFKQKTQSPFLFQDLFFLFYLALLLIAFKFLGGDIAFLLCKKKKIVLEFDKENFMCDGKAVKWADVQKISYQGYSGGRRGKQSYIFVYYLFRGQVIKDVLKKEDIVKDAEKVLNITDDVILKSFSKTAKLIVDKFYQYYGFSHGVTLKKNFLLGQYELKSTSGKGVLSKNSAKNIDNVTQMPKMFR